MPEAKGKLSEEINMQVHKSLKHWSTGFIDRPIFVDVLLKFRLADLADLWVTK